MRLKDSTEDVFASLAPADRLMAVAWYDGMRWALGNEELVRQFRTETGHNWTPGRSALERLIDEATGADRAFLRQFAAWFNDTIWGDTSISAG